jgi:hypothetical protein
MGQIIRHDVGTARMPVTLLQDIEWVLDMDTASSRDVVWPLAAQLQIYDRDLSLDRERDCVEGIHDWLRVCEVDAVQRLRGWNRLRYGTITVSAANLCTVRNLFDTLLYEWSECDDYLLGLDDGDPAEVTIVRRAVKEGVCCNRCPHCKFCLLRDRIDVLLDRQGFSGGSQYQAYAAPRAYDPDAIWRDQVLPPAIQVLAAWLTLSVSAGRR